LLYTRICAILGCNNCHRPFAEKAVLLTPQKSGKGSSEGLGLELGLLLGSGFVYYLCELRLHCVPLWSLQCSLAAFSVIQGRSVTPAINR